ncbi:hypothetical protein pb186bvf_015205 [Paramecium bursaria]
MDDLVEVSEEQLKKYQQFAIKLNQDLEKVNEQVEAIQTKIYAYEQTSELILNDFDKIDIGGNIYLDCQWENKGKVILDVGLQCFIELNYDEAKPIIERQINLLKGKLKSVLVKRNEIESYILQLKHIIE